MSQVDDPTEILYKEFHGHSNAVNNILQFYYNKIQELKVQNQMLTKARDELENKLKNFEQPKKVTQDPAEAKKK